MFTTFRKVLVANRGEVALRILRACSELGMSTVAVYSEVDRNSLHVRYADQAFLIGPAAARDSYLRIDKLIEVARLSGADGIHPGYGFLAESPKLAAACRDAGIGFVGPSPEVVALMGDKLAARKAACDLGIPVIPGSDGPIESIDHARQVADEIGFPVIIKAVAGGGGKGMRVVEHPDALAAAMAGARGEAAAAFGDDRVYIEKALDGVRHVEFQILADRFGNAVHLGERECSIQRRHQKLIEEAPSASVDAGLREEMGCVAVRLARAVGYESAGTVEFLLDRDKRYYFLEMNTRLQVEHPITELITGVDIVTEQLRIAAGRRLRIQQSDIRPKGWAIECRIAAEDPYNDFLPSIGRINNVYEPSGPGVRVDSAIYDGCEVTLYYDSLIAKLICWGETRGQAILRMRRALSEFKILGVKTNIPFHLQLMDSPTFIANRIDTRYLERQTSVERTPSKDGARLAAIAAAAVAYRAQQEALARAAEIPRGDGTAWRSTARKLALR